LSHDSLIIETFVDGGFLIVGFLKAGIFFFQPFVLKQKVEPKIQGRFKKVIHLSDGSLL
jgi:hypothetical protein